MNRKTLNKQAGITLIELMVTLAVLAIISSIAIPAYKGYIKTSHRTECQNEVAAIKLAEEEHYLENGGYFSGADATQLQSNSSSIYSASTAATSGNCTYSVVTGTNTYTITANARTGGKLDGETNPIYTFTK